MRSFNLQYEDKNSLEQFIKSHSIKNYGNILIQIFSGLLDEEYILDLSSYIKKLLPQANIIGSSTSGEICQGKIYDNTVIISFSIFKDTVVKSKLYNLDENFRVESIADELILDNTKALIVFSDGLKSNADKILKGIYKLKPEMLIAGGRAGDNAKFKKTYIFDEKSCSEEACVIATLSGDSLIANSDYILNWTPIGRDMIVTKADGNILYELDGMPIFEVYRKYLGEEVARNLPKTTMEFPLIVKKENLDVARDPLVKNKDGSLVFAGNFDVGDSVRFSFGSVDDITADISKNFDDFNKFPAESIFVYSCAARKSLLGKKLLDELNMLESLAPTVGFFTYGEYFHTSNIAELLNVTTTFLALSESSKIKQRSLKKNPVREYDLVKRALTNLVKVTTQELEHLSTHDTLTSIHNRMEYTKRIGLKIKNAQRYDDSFGLILMDIDHFKQINDNYGHAVGDEVLQKIAKLFMENLREDDFVARWGGEEFIMIVNHANVDGLKKLIQKLQKKIENATFIPVLKLTLSFGLTMYVDGDDENSLFKRVDNAMYVAKENGRNTYVVG